MIYKIAALYTIDMYYKKKMVGYRIYSDKDRKMKDVSMGNYLRIIDKLGFEAIDTMFPNIDIWDPDEIITEEVIDNINGLITGYKGLKHTLVNDEFVAYKSYTLKSGARCLIEAVDLHGTIIKVLYNEVFKDRRYTGSIEEEGRFRGMAKQKPIHWSNNLVDEVVADLKVPEDTPLGRMIKRENSICTRLFEVIHIGGENILVRYCGKDNEVVEVPQGITMIAHSIFESKNSKHFEVRQIVLPDTVWYVTSESFKGSSINSVRLGENIRLFSYRRQPQFKTNLIFLDSMKEKIITI